MVGERGGSVVECRTPEREVQGSRPTAAVLCPWARHFTPRKYWLITQEAMAPSRYDWKIVDWDVKPQHNQPYWMAILRDGHFNEKCVWERNFTCIFNVCFLWTEMTLCKFCFMSECRQVFKVVEMNYTIKAWKYSPQISWIRGGVKIGKIFPIFTRGIWNSSEVNCKIYLQEIKIWWK